MSTMTGSEAQAVAGAAPAPGRRIDWGRLAAYAFLILIAIAYIGPLLMLVMTSFKTLPEFTKDATSLPASFSLDTMEFKSEFSAFRCLTRSSKREMRSSFLALENDIPKVNVL